MGTYILAHDLGTSGNKASLFDEAGQLIGSCTKSYWVTYLNETWAEQNPDDWWQAVCSATRELLEVTGVEASAVKVVSFSGQMMGCLNVDRSGRPLRNAIIWADQRAEQQMKSLTKQISDVDFYQTTGHRNTSSYGLQKLMWVRDNQPEIYRDTYKVLNAKDYIVWKLTGQFLTDYSDAASMDCFDIHKLKWSERILDIADIDSDKLPEAMPSTHIAGEVHQKAADEVRLRAGTTVVIGAGDGVTANIGAGSVKPGKAFCCMGTSAWVATSAEEPVLDPARRFICWPHAIPGLYSPNGTMQYAGGAFDWLKATANQLNPELTYEELIEMAKRSEAGCGGVIFLPHLLGERAPRWNAYAKAGFLGVREETKAEDFARSVMEGVAFNLNLSLEALAEFVPIEEMVLIGGGARNELWREILASVFNHSLKIPAAVAAGNSMGAAVIGGVATGIYKDFEVVADFLEFNNQQKPNSKWWEIYKKHQRLFCNCYEVLEPLFEQMS